MSTQIRLRHVDASDPTPKYLQTQRILTEAIRVGDLPAGSKLPSTKDIGSLVKVSLITAHKALEGLVDAGLLRREVGRGTFVREDAASSITSRRHLAIGLVLDPRVNLNDFYHSSILNGLRQSARLDSDKVEFFFQDDFRPPQRRRASTTGVICIHPSLEAHASVVRMAERTPTVVLGGSFPDEHIACIDCDNRTGAADAVRHLLSLGHRRFMLICGPTNLSNSRDRAEGAREALTQAGVDFADRDVLITDDSVTLDENARTALEKRLRSAGGPTAIFAGGYYLALAAMHAVRQAELSIPRDVSVVGFDDPASAPLLHPPLTTIRQPLTEMADRAFGMLRRLMIDGHAQPGTTLLPTQIVVRGTTGPAKG